MLGALARRADEIYAGLNEEEREAARQLFLRLVTLGEGVEDTRRRVRTAELDCACKQQASDGSECIEAFGKYRLLTFDLDPVSKGPTVEVAHEALIRTWGKLREWLDASRADLRVQRQLMGAMAEWERAGRDRELPCERSAAGAVRGASRRSRAAGRRSPHRRGEGIPCGERGGAGQAGEGRARKAGPGASIAEAGGEQVALPGGRDGVVPGWWR